MMSLLDCHALQDDGYVPQLLQPPDKLWFTWGMSFHSKFLSCSLPNPRTLGALSVHFRCFLRRKCTKILVHFGCIFDAVSVHFRCMSWHWIMLGRCFRGFPRHHNETPLKSTETALKMHRKYTQSAPRSRRIPGAKSTENALKVHQ